MNLRKEVVTYLYDPGKKFFHVTIELKNVPGALGDVLSILHELDMNVLGSFSSVDVGAKTGHWSGFVEDSRHTAWELEERISKSESVLESVVTESKEGFLGDMIHFPISSSIGDRAVLMTVRYLSAMFDRTRELFKTGGETILYEEGFAYGKARLEAFVSELGLDFVRLHLQDIIGQYQAVGWFRLEVLEENKGEKTVTIRAGQNFECEGKNSDSPYSQFIRGHLAGALSAVEGQKMRCDETSCIAKGDRVCEFVLRQAKASGMNR